MEISNIYSRPRYFNPVAFTRDVSGLQGIAKQANCLLGFLVQILVEMMKDCFWPVRRIFLLPVFS